MDKHGQCKLCGHGCQLQESHIVPRWAYKRLHGDKARPTQPVQMINGVAVQMPKQIKEPLLCTMCEQEIGIVEKTVAGMVTGSHPFSSLFSSRSWDAKLGAWLADASGVDFVTLCRFAVSIFWRASVASSVPKVRLGPYDELCRGYLAGESPFP